MVQAGSAALLAIHCLHTGAMPGLCVPRGGMSLFQEAGAKCSACCSWNVQEVQQLLGILFKGLLGSLGHETFPCSLTSVFAQIQMLLCPQHVEHSESQAGAEAGLHEMAVWLGRESVNSSVLLDYSAPSGVSHVNSEGCELVLMVWQIQAGRPPCC